MRRLLLPILTTVFAFLALLSSLQVVRAQAPDEDAPLGTVSSPASPAGGDFMSTDYAYCRQPDASQDACYITYRGVQMSGGSTGAVITAMSVTLVNGTDTRLVAVYQPPSHSETSYQWTVRHDSDEDGLRVACGAPGVDGVANYGEIYGLRFHMSSVTNGFKHETTHEREIACPAYDPGTPTAVGANSFSAALNRLSRHQATFVALAVATGLLVNLLVPARLKQWRKRTES
jgi:hypothetical protein